MRWFTTRGARRRIPQLEVLEDRTVPTCTCTLSSGVLLIKGSAGTDKVKILDTGLAASSSQNNVTVQCDGQSKSFKHVQKIQVNTFGGHDEVSYTLTGPLQAGQRTVVVDLGTGPDQFTGSLKGGIPTGAELDLYVRGDPASDDLGSPDGIVVSGDNISIGGKLKLDLDGDWGNDVILVGWKGSLTGQLDINVRGNLGTDTLFVDLQPQTFGAGSLTAHLDGGSGADKVTLNVTGATPQQLDAVIDADAADTVSHTPNVHVV